MELRLNLNVRVPDDLDSLCLSLGPVGSVTFARQYPITAGGEAQTLVVLPGDQTADRFEAIVSAELRRGVFQFDRRVIDFVDGEVTSNDVPVGGDCATGKPTGSGLFEQQPRRITDTGTATAIAAIPAPGHPALVLASSLAGGSTPRFAFLPGQDTVATLEGDTPNIAGPVKRLLPFDLESGTTDGVCARDFAAITDSGVELWRNRGGNAFDKRASAGVGAGFIDGVARDFDGDGITDLVLVSPTQLALLFGGADGSFSRERAREPSGLSDVTSIAAGFFDDPSGEGRTLDLVLGRKGQKDLVLLNKSGDGDFSAPSSQLELGDAKDTIAVAVVRSTKLGLDDVASSDGSAVYLFAQTEPGKLVQVGLPQGVDTADVARIYGVDVNGDCARDLVLVRSEASGKNSAVLLYDRIKQGYSAASSVLPAGRELVVVDFDGDGVRDVILSSQSGGTELYRQLPVQQGTTP